MKEILICIGFLSLILAIPVGLWLEIRRGRKEEKEMEKKKAALQLEADKMTKSVVKFIVGSAEYRSRLVSAEVYTSWHGISNYEYKICPSKDKAHSLMNAFYKQTFFTDEHGITYPACNVHSAWFEELT